jgi:hypothetical protein
MGELLTLPGRPAPSVAVHLRRFMVLCLFVGVALERCESEWEDVPTAVELGWRPDADQAAASSLVGVTVAMVASRATRRAGRCR